MPICKHIHTCEKKKERGERETAITDHTSTNRESPSLSFLQAYIHVKNDLSFHSSDIADHKILQFDLLTIFGQNLTKIFTLYGI